MISKLGTLFLERNIVRIECWSQCRICRFSNDNYVSYLCIISMYYMYFMYGNSDDKNPIKNKKDAPRCTDHFSY